MPETHAAVDLRSATPTKQLVLKRTIKASPERIFDAFTDPDQLKKWWWPNGGGYLFFRWGRATPTRRVEVVDAGRN
jgi:uncharacterized protein YndB with AHSA1/START domain